MNRDRQILPLLNALPVFEVAARTESFTRAANELGMTQPSVSRFIAKLESYIGVSLFDRRHNRITLTAEGTKLYEVTALGLGHIKSVIEELSQESKVNTVTIGCTHGIAHMWLMSRVESLQTLLPGTEIRITTMEHVANFSTAEVDLAVRFGNGEWSDGEAHLLFEEEVFPVCSPSFAIQHNLQTGTPERAVSPDELLSLPLLVQDLGENGWLCWQSWFARFNVDFAPPKSAYTIFNYAFILQAAMEGKGITLAWENLTEPYLSNKWLIELSGLRVRTGNGYFLVFSPDNPVAGIARTWVKNHV